MSELKVKIGADLDALRQGIADAVKMVTGVEPQMQTAVKSVERSFKIIDNHKFTFGENYVAGAKLAAAASVEAVTATANVGRSFTLLNASKFTFGENYARASSKLATEAAKSAAVLGGSMKTGANQAAFALTNLGRVAQDAPFGFIGIQNNLNPLLESFQRLKAETGSTGGALKALTGSLMGPAGIGIALSVVSAGILLYQQYQQKAKKATDEGTDANKKNKDSLDSLANSAGQEIAKLTVLYDATQNLNIPLNERRKIVDKLQSQYPSYFGNLKDEAILAGNAEAAYNALTQSLINNAIVKGGENMISARVSELAKSLIAFQEEQRKFSEKTGGKGFIAEGNSFNVDENGDLEALNNYEARVKEEIAGLRKSIQSLVGNFNAAEILGNFGEGPENKKKPKKADNSELIQALKDERKGLEIEWEELEAFFEKTSRTSTIGEVFKDEAIAVQDASVLIGDAIERIQSQYAASQYAETVKQLDEQNKILSDSFAEGFGAIGDSIGRALVNGTSVLEAFGQSVLSTIGGILQQFGKLTLAAGIASTALGKALRNPWNPGSGVAAIAAGVALIAIGGAVNAFAGNLGNGGGGSSASGGGDSQYNVPGFANGVTNFRGGVALVGERGPELVNLPTGSDVIPNHQMSSFMGGGSQVIIPEVVIKGQDLKIVFNRANRDRG